MDRQSRSALTCLGIQSEVDGAEQSLRSAVEVLERAAVLGQQGANDTQSPEQRLMISREVETLIEQMVGLTRTTVEARHIFSGDADEQAPFTIDLSLDDPVSNYLGANATREVLHPTGSRFVISKTGEEIFDNPDPDKNVMEAINNLRIALRDNDEAAIVTTLGQIQSAQVHLSGELAFYGAAQNQVTEAIDFAHKQELRLKSGLSEIEETDMVDAIVTLNQVRYQQEVALSSQASLKKISLFDFI